MELSAAVHSGATYITLVITNSALELKSLSMHVCAVHKQCAFILSHNAIFYRTNTKHIHPNVRTYYVRTHNKYRIIFDAFIMNFD